jgi:hypothetical protein
MKLEVSSIKNNINIVTENWGCKEEGEYFKLVIIIKIKS